MLDGSMGENGVMSSIVRSNKTRLSLRTKNVRMGAVYFISK